MTKTTNRKLGVMFLLAVVALPLFAMGCGSSPVAPVIPDNGGDYRNGGGSKGGDTQNGSTMG